MARHAALSQTEFDALLAWLAPGRDQAGEKYESARRMLTRYFEWRQCKPADEYVDETIDRVARRLAAGEHVRSADPETYFRGVARNVCLECHKQKTQETRTAPLSIPTTCCDPSPLPACLEHCLQTLSREGRELLEAYYLKRRVDLPARLGITPNAVRLRVFKEKQKLRDCVARCMTLTSESPSLEALADFARLCCHHHSALRK
jgi:DNA-directed RNA polymerase specialized sigma24 family protein